MKSASPQSGLACQHGALQSLQSLGSQGATRSGPAAHQNIPDGGLNGPGAPNDRHQPTQHREWAAAAGGAASSVRHPDPDVTPCVGGGGQTETARLGGQTQPCRALRAAHGGSPLPGAISADSRHTRPTDSGRGESEPAAAGRLAELTGGKSSVNDNSCAGNIRNHSKTDTSLDVGEK